MASNAIQLFIKKPGLEPASFDVALSITFGELKKIADLVGWGLFYRTTKRNNGTSLEEIGVKSGHTIHAFPPAVCTGDTGSAQYQAQRRLCKGLTQRSTAHHGLHRQTQSVMMDESQRIRETVDKRCDGLDAKVDRLLAYHGKIPPSNPDDLDLMEKIG